MSEAPDQEEGLRRRSGVANPREEFERRYGPLWSGQSSLEIGGATHELEDVMHRAGFGFEGLESSTPLGSKPGASPSVSSTGTSGASSAWSSMWIFNLLEEHRVHIAEWLGDAYFETEWQVNCPMDF